MNNSTKNTELQIKKVKLINFKARIIRRDIYGADMPRLYPEDETAKSFGGNGRNGTHVQWSKIGRNFQEGDIVEVTIRKIANAQP